MDVGEREFRRIPGLRDDLIAAQTNRYQLIIRATAETIGWDYDWRRDGGALTDVQRA